MRLVYPAAHYAPWTPGGSAESVRIQAEALVRAGVAVAIVTPLWGDAPREEERSGVRIVRVPTGLELPHGPSLEPQRVWFRIHRQLAKAIEREAKGADLIHAQDRRVAPATMLAMKRSGVPGLLTLRDIGAWCPLATCLLTHRDIPRDCGFPRLLETCIPDYRRTHDPNASQAKIVGAYAALGMERWLAEHRFARVLFVSEALRRAYQQAGAYRDTPTGVVPSPVEEGEPKPGARNRNPVAMYAGKPSPGKGWPQFAEATALLAARCHALHVGPYPPEGSAPHVYSIGPETPQGVPHWYRGAYVVVVPSVAMDALPRVALEAQAQERPVVGFRRGGLPEIVDDGVTGVLVGMEDPVSMTGKALAEGIERALAESERMGNAGRRRVLALFGASVVTERLLGVYRGVLSGA